MSEEHSRLYSRIFDSNGISKILILGAKEIEELANKLISDGAARIEITWIDRFGGEAETLGIKEGEGCFRVAGFRKDWNAKTGV